MPPDPSSHRPPVDGRTLNRFATWSTVLLALLGMLAGWIFAPLPIEPVAPSLVAGAEDGGSIDSPSSDTVAQSPHERSDVLDVELRELEVGEDDAPERLAATGRAPFGVPEVELHARGLVSDATVTTFAVRSRRDGRGADFRTIASSRGPPRLG